MNQNYYLTNANMANSTTPSGWSDSAVTYIGSGNLYEGGIKVSQDHGKIAPELYFTYIKKKFNILERMKLDARIKKIEAAFDEAVEAGQSFLADKILHEFSREIRESVILAKGISKYIEREDLVKYKHKIKEGHISDTLLKDYTRIIPKPILEKVKSLKDVFDGFVIYHYYEEALEKKKEKKQKITPTEKAKLKDPVIFGIIRETNRLYFIEEWVDEFCDLTFEDIVDQIGESRIGKKIDLGIKK